MSLDLEYFYGNEAEQYSFYRIPKTLFIDQRHKSVSMEAKVLYGLMLDRMGLSIRSGWLDGDGRVYIYFTLEDAIDAKGITINKLATLSGITQSTVENVVHGKTRNPRLKTLHRLAYGLDMTVSELMDFPEMNEKVVLPP